MFVCFFILIIFSPAYNENVHILYTIRILEEKIMEIRTFGGGGRVKECERTLLYRGADLGGRLILLPIPTSRDNKYITATADTVESVTAMIRPGDRLVGYNIPETIRAGAELVGASVYDGALDEKFLCENAELTARGALGYILTHTNRDVADMHVGVVGYGRIGIRMVRLLLMLGARITVYTGRESVALELGEMGVSACLVGKENDYTSLNILVNTAPARQIDEQDVPKHIDIIDLASGSIFEPSGRLIKLAQVPDVFYPVTAGRLYAEGALRHFRGDRL